MKQIQLGSVIILSFGICLTSVVNAQSRLESKFISRVSQHRLQQTVCDLVKIGNRFGGTKSGNKAAYYVAERFKNYGYKPVTVKDEEMLTFTNVKWELSIEKPKKLRGLIQHEWLACYSPSAKERVSRLTFVPSIKGIDADKIDSGAVLIEGHAYEKFYNELVEAGARAILSYESVKSGAYTNSAMITSLKQGSSNPIPVFNISCIAGKRIRKELESGGLVEIRYSAKTRIFKANPKTVIATLKGVGDDYIIVCAHGDSDSGGPGADDNASGVAGVLEVARVLHTFVHENKIPLPKKSIRFIVWGSEYHSSSSYVKVHANNLKKIAAVINYDEIGIGKSRDCLYFEGNDIEHNRELLRLFERVGEDYVDKKGFWKEATTIPSQDGTDAYIFLPKYLDRLDAPNVEIPSVTVFTAAWNEPKVMEQTRSWLSKAWKGHPDSIIIDYSPYFHSSLDIPVFTTDKEPSNMVWGVDAVGIALIRLLWD